MPNTERFDCHFLNALKSSRRLLRRMRRRRARSRQLRVVREASGVEKTKLEAFFLSFLALRHLRCYSSKVLQCSGSAVVYRPPPPKHSRVQPATSLPEHARMGFGFRFTSGGTLPSSLHSPLRMLSSSRAFIVVCDGSFASDFDGPGPDCPAIHSLALDGSSGFYTFDTPSSIPLVMQLLGCSAIGGAVSGFPEGTGDTLSARYHGLKCALFRPHPLGSSLKRGQV
jgi:hypothetical protein